MKDFVILLPEIFLILTAGGILLSEVGYAGERNRLVAGTALLGIFGSIIQTLLMSRFVPIAGFGGDVAVDGIAVFFKLYFLALAALLVVSIHRSSEISKDHLSEFYALIVGATVAMCIAAEATSGLLIVVVLQLLGVLSYSLCALSKRSVLSAEAAVKQLIMGAFSTLCLLFAFCILFVFAGSLNLHEIHQELLIHPLTKEAGLATFLLFLMGFAFQMGAFPLSLSKPDAIEGTSTTVSAYVVLGFRVSGFAVFLRLLLEVFSSQVPGVELGWQVLGVLQWPQVLAVISGLTMLIGSFMSLRQIRAKRLLAYLMIAETGQLLMGLLVLSPEGLSALLYSFVAQLLSVIGAFYVLSYVHDRLSTDRLDQMRGIFGWAAPEGICFYFFLFCIVGLPPMPSFFGKFALIGAAVQQHWYVLSMLAIFSGALSTTAVARLVFGLSTELGQPGPVIIKSEALSAAVPRRIFLFSLVGPLLLVGVFAQGLLRWATHGLRLILW